ncbi:hypothetical protein [Streptomyces halobius]|uniref:Uncharacterized protein n=1 Tax=Streptomyces halobius TaxID=2879846 RepID=A0ABY4M448_9ACTN|nr:hypothetical protein [Streptomyces halobius]UQA91963.1 hypothetical protein K9S39_08950 [Streptomyces halobius]
MNSPRGRPLRPQASALSTASALCARTSVGGFAARIILVLGTHPQYGHPPPTHSASMLGSSSFERVRVLRRVGTRAAPLRLRRGRPFRPVRPVRPGGRLEQGSAEGAQPLSRGRTLNFLGGLAEGGKTIAVHTLWCLLPAYAHTVAWGWAAVVAVTAVHRVVTGYRVLC